MSVAFVVVVDDDDDVAVVFMVRYHVRSPKQIASTRFEKCI